MNWRSSLWRQLKKGGCLENSTGAQGSEPGRLEEIHKALVLGTGDYIRKNGFNKVVIGLSGKIDSSLTAAILL